MSSLSENIEQVRARIEAACVRTGRKAEEVTLVAVSKNHSPARVSEAAELGLQVFGENRVQEARAKIPQCPGRLQWHMIGHLQSNKVRDAVGLFFMIESVDSLSLAEEVNKRADQVARTIPILAEINMAGESSKYGYKPEAFLADLESLARLPRLELYGLMTVAPWSPNPEKVRPVFRKMRELKQTAEERLGVPLAHLSMGMSGDFEVAIEEGSTIVRIGTAIFGERRSAET